MKARFVILAICGAVLLAAPQTASSQFFGPLFGPKKPADPSAAPKTTAPKTTAPKLPPGTPPVYPAGPKPGATQAPAGWMAADPENTWVIDTSKGRIVAALNPIVAPASVERIKRLTRAKFYDGHKFFRVIDDFMDQTGDPENNGDGGSALPDLPGEFSFRRNSGTVFTPVPTALGFTGLIGAVPVQSQPDGQMLITADRAVQANGLFCPGVLGMARGEEPNSANSQFFLMRAAYPTLNGAYTVFGRVIAGMDVVKAIKLGEPPAEPMDTMVKVQMLADIPAADRPKIFVADTASKVFRDYAAAWLAYQGGGADICKLDILSVVQ